MKSHFVIFMAVIFSTGIVFAATDANSPSGIESSVTEANVPQKVVDANTDIAVTVNGHVITESEIEVKIRPQLAQAGKQLPPQVVELYKQKIRQQALESMIVERLLDEEVTDSNIVITAADVNDEIVKMAARQNLSLDDFEALIKNYGRSMDEIKERIRAGLRYQRLMQRQFEGKINVSEEDAKEYYDKNPDEFKIPEQVRASHILVKPDTEDPNTDPNKAKADAKAQAEDLLTQIRQGADFNDLAKQHSDCPSAANSGDLGLFPRGAMFAPFEQAAFSLPVGQISDLVETRAGYHIIKVTEHQDPNTAKFEQAKDDIVNMLMGQQEQELVAQYIQSLKDKATIVYPPGKDPNQTQEKAPQLTP